MPLIETKGAASAQGFGEFAQQTAATYIEDVFSTWLYSGNSSTQTITNGIDLAGKGGIVLFKSRNNATNWNLYSTTSASPWYYLSTLSTEAIQTGSPSRLQSFNSNGFTLGADYPNYSGYTFASWTFRKQPKFFDVVTYTGNGGTQQNIPHNLQAYPGLIIVKRTDSAGNWYVCPIMQSNWNNDYLLLNSAAGKVSSVNIWQSTSGTSLTTFGVLDGSTVNISGATYVAYLFADSGSGGFGLTGSDNVISCGSFTTDVNGRATITLNYEPQWLLVKRTSGGTGNWEIADNMRGWTVSGNASLYPNLANVENNPDNYKLTATGFSADNGVASSDFIYIAIRRGPMKVPTSGTSVFVPITYTGSGTAGTVITTGIVTDMVWSTSTLYGGGVVDYDRLRGAAKVLQTGSAGQEQNEAGTAIGLQGFDLQNGYYAGPDQGSGTINYSGYPYVNWVFRRAPKFFDEVCYTGDGGATKLINHNLGVAPELLIVKIRNGSDNWWVYNSSTGSGWRVRLNASSSEQNDTAPKMWGTTFSSTQFQVGDNIAVNNNATNYVAYLFATCPGVSKVGTYTGTGPGTLITVNCGFTSGARFVLIRRLYGGDWYVYDSARGISSGSDPYLTLNGYSAQTTGTNYVDTTSVGFQVTAAAPFELNTNGLTFLFLAIA